MQAAPFPFPFATVASQRMMYPHSRALQAPIVLRCPCSHAHSLILRSCPPMFIYQQALLPVPA